MIENAEQTMSRRLLLVEDDDGSADIYSRILRLDGFHVRTALDAETAWQAAIAQGPRFDAMIIDLRMPVVDGLALLRRVRESDLRTVPVTMITGDYWVSAETTDEIKRL